MNANPLRRVFTTKAMLLVGLSIMVAVALAIISMAPGDQAGAAQQKAKPKATVSFGAKEVINTTGDKALTGTYQKRKGGTLFISAAGSGYSATGEQKIGMTVLINGSPVGTAQVYTNEKDSHKAFVPAFEVLNNVPKGQVNIELKPFTNPDTKIDQNDYFRVTVEEQPRG